MSTYVNFVTSQFCKNNSPMIAYLSDDEIVPFIKIAQDIHLQRVLGTNLMKDLQAKVLANTLNADEITLMDDYIQFTLVYCVVYEHILFNHYKMTNKGITKQTSDNSQSADLGEINFVRNDIRNKSEYFKDRLAKYLTAKASLFPAFWGGTSDVSTIQPTYNNFYSGIYTGKRRGKKGCTDCGPGEVGPWTWINLI